jgi:hypothetical protein
MTVVFQFIELINMINVIGFYKNIYNDTLEFIKNDSDKKEFQKYKKCYFICRIFCDEEYIINNKSKYYHYINDEIIKYLLRFLFISTGLLLNFNPEMITRFKENFISNTCESLEKQLDQGLKEQEYIQKFNCVKTGLELFIKFINIYTFIQDIEIQDNNIKLSVFIPFQNCQCIEHNFQTLILVD